MGRYDEQLISDTIGYYQALDGRHLTPEQAERYLDSLADWYDCLVAFVAEGREGGAMPPQSGGESAPPLLPPHVASNNTYTPT